MLYDKKWDEQLPTNTENFKTAAELGLRDAEYSDLMRLLIMFEHGKIPGNLFNMQRIGAPKCGTAGCLIGWARTFNEHSFTNDLNTTNENSLNLEVCELLSSAWAEATPTHATIALRNFLTTGSAKWREVLANN